MLARVRNYMLEQGMLHQKDRMVMGVSGGADSVCLACLLAQLRCEFGLELYVVHVHHGIRGEEADQDAQFVRELCEKLHIACEVIKKPIPQMAAAARISEEEMGRKVRYEILEEVRMRVGGHWIAVAHNREDNAETILWNLCRGTGLTGLTGIRPVRGVIIRPLLFCNRAEIEAWLAAYGQDWRVDRTNQTEDYTRNRIRHQILPLLTESINHQAVAHITETAEILTQLRDYVKDQTEQELAKLKRQWHTKPENRQLVWLEEDYWNCPAALRSEVIAALLQMVSGHKQNFTAEHIRSVKGMFEKNVGRQVSLPYGWIARRTYEGICLEHCHNTIKEEKIKEESRKMVYELRPEKKEKRIQLGKDGLYIRYWIWELTKACAPCYRNCNNAIKNSCTKWFDYDKITNTIVIRTRREGDRLVIHPDGRKRKLKDYWIDCKLPRLERDRRWLLAAGNDILWILGDRTGEGCRMDEQTKRILVVQMEDEDGRQDSGINQ